MEWAQAHSPGKWVDNLRSYGKREGDSRLIELSDRTQHGDAIFWGSGLAHGTPNCDGLLGWCQVEFGDGHLE